ncbi:hypothetical protein KPH14_010712 [Odynerus spinipes]|uniref:CLIP domain-containing serine protease n=1 Tax=Odynerus spinipes TaxID=1348599 RepID=A0AAD9RUY6_9HYME|nr:hypothetical protein KPH14_010712 [Odynerus spinipes]
MWAITVFSFVGLLTILPHYASAQGALSCVNPLGRNGRCINIRQCQPLLQILQQQRRESIEFLRASVCGYEGTDPRVCCPNDSTDGDRDTKSVGNTSYGPLLPPECGTSYGEHGRIVGGMPATLGSWPWVTALGYRNKKNPDVPRFLCGGSLVSIRHVVTAGHCIYHRTDLFMARVGDLDLNSTGDGAEPIDILIEKKILHPEYNPTTYTNDIGIIRLAEDVSFSRNLHPICLPVSQSIHDLDLDGTFPFIAGWGSVYFNGPSSSKLLELQIPIVEQGRCKEAFKSFSNAVIDDRILCAGFARGGKDACQGDSGGPLMIPHNKSYYLVGVVSYGSGHRCQDRSECRW